MIKFIKQTLLLAILLSGLVSFAQVGINTDDSNPDPSSMLDVKSNDKGMLIPRMTAAERDLIGTPATGLMVFVTDDNNFYFYDGSIWDQVGGADDDWLFNGPEIYRMGNVGIGNTNPSYVFDVTGTFGPRLRVFSQDGYFAGLLSKNNTREFFAGVQADYETSNATSGYHIYDNTAGARRMVIDELGNMGVGASNPTSKLDVRGNNIDDGVIISVGNSDESHKLMLFGGRQNDPNPFIQWKDGDPLRFATDASGFTEHMRINGNGDVGIGTTSPEDRLHVKGNMQIDSGRIEFANNNLNVAVGSSALLANTSGSQNTAIGGLALTSNTTGTANMAIGAGALQLNTTGVDNTASGMWALISNTTGDFNTASGFWSLNSNTSGNQNTAMGLQALSSNTTGSQNSAFGAGANVGSGDLTNATAIGAGAVVSQDSSLVLGNFANVGIGTSTPDEKLHVEGALKIVDGTEGMGKVLVSDSTGVSSWANLSDVISTSDTTQPIPIQYHGSQIYVHPTDNGTDVDWTTASANCDALVAFTYDDWYLPTRLELDAIYKQSYLITGLSQTAFAKYWSSTEADVSNAFSQRLDYGGPDPDAKTEATGHNCRCIRKN